MGSYNPGGDMVPKWLEKVLVDVTPEDVEWANLDLPVFPADAEFVAVVPQDVRPLFVAEANLRTSAEILGVSPEAAWSTHQADCLRMMIAVSLCQSEINPEKWTSLVRGWQIVKPPQRRIILAGDEALAAMARFEPLARE